MSVSWLVLERYAMGDLPTAARREVERALEHDEVAQRRLDLIQGDERTPPPLGMGADSGLPLPEAAPRPHRRTPWWVVGTGLAAAAALWVLTPSEPPEGLEKGGELVVSVQTDRGVALEEGASVAVGTVVRVRTTWMERAPARLEADGALLWEGVHPGGNRRPIPGAWAVGEGPVELCVWIEAERACRTVVGVRK